MDNVLKKLHLPAVVVFFTVATSYVFLKFAPYSVPRSKLQYGKYWSVRSPGSSI